MTKYKHLDQEIDFLTGQLLNFYRDWQPKYAAYNNWPSDQSEKRKLQAIIEMVGESGEVLQIATKSRRKDQEIPREKIIDELGDTFWGLVGVMNEFDISWTEMINFNVEKLNKRNENNIS